MAYEFTGSTNGAIYSNVPLNYAFVRHDSVHCEPGKWAVVRWIGGADALEWAPAFKVQQAVVDDFGNLVRAQ